jgi:hypothetical protein
MPTFSTGYGVYKPAEFATPCITYRRNLAAPRPSVEIGRDIEFGMPTSNYRRNLAAPAQGIGIVHAVHLGEAFTALPKVRGIYQPTILIDVSAGQYHGGDSGIEIVYNIPNRLRIRPRLIAPPNGSQHRTASPVMIWTPTIEAMYYEVHVARDINFLDRVARLDVIDTQLQLGWDFGATYYWRLRAVAGTAWSDYSEVWSFIVPPFIEDLSVDHVSGGKSRLLNQFREDA